MASQATTDAVLLAELERSRRMLAEAQSLARIGSWEWDVAANQVSWSDELFRIYGYEPQAFEPTYEAFLAHVTSTTANRSTSATTGPSPTSSRSRT